MNTLKEMWEVAKEAVTSAFYDYFYPITNFRSFCKSLFKSSKKSKDEIR